MPKTSSGEPIAAASPYCGGICCVAVEHVGREHGDALVAAEQERRRELPEAEQERDAGAVHERRAQQRQHDAEEDAVRDEPLDLRGLDQLAVDVLEARR